MSLDHVNGRHNEAETLEHLKSLRSIGKLVNFRELLQQDISQVSFPIT